MSDNKFNESMEVEAVGTLKPGDIEWGTCDGCPKNTCKNPGVLIQGITQEAALLPFQKVEIVPEGTKAKVAELEASNAELMEALKSALDLCRFYREAGSCETCIAKRTCNIYNAINKAEVDGR